MAQPKKEEQKTGPYSECPNCEYEFQRSAAQQGIVETDLTSITRSADKVKTVVYLCDEFGHRELKWLVFGECCLLPARENQRPTRWLLQAYLGHGATDWEHDSAYALRVPLTALDMQMVMGSNVMLGAVIDGRNPDDFRVPPPDYNPIAAGEVCDSDSCERKHIIVPEGCYLPAPNLKLLPEVMGRQVEISIYNSLR